MISYRRIIALAGSVLFLACNRAQDPVPPSSGLSREEFIELFVALRNAQDSARSAAQFDSMKTKIFDRAGASPESLTRFAAEHGAQVRFMSEVWDSIRSRLDYAVGVTTR